MSTYGEHEGTNAIFGEHSSHHTPLLGQVVDDILGRMEEHRDHHQWVYGHDGRQELEESAERFVSGYVVMHKKAIKADVRRNRRAYRAFAKAEYGFLGGLAGLILPFLVSAVVRWLVGKLTEWYVRRRIDDWLTENA